MTKSDAVGYFGSEELTAHALGISGVAVRAWPEELSPAIAARVVVAAIQLDGVTAARRAFPSMFERRA